MARYLYGGGGDGDIIKPDGTPHINMSANVYNARTGGTQITDLQDLTGAAITTVTTDGFGQAAFYGPDDYTGVLWLDFGSGVRWALSPKDVDAAAARTIATQRAADASAASATQKAALPYSTADPLEQALATQLDPLVIPRFSSQAARNAAFPSPQHGDRCFRTDLGCEQVYNGFLGAWRNTTFAFNSGSTGGLVTVTNTASETILFSIPVPANSNAAGAVYRITAFGRAIQAASTTPTLTWRLRVGGLAGVSLAATQVTAANNASPGNRPWLLQAHVGIDAIGTNGMWFGSLRTETTLTSTTTLMTANPTVRLDGTVRETRSTTVNQTLDVSVQWGTASSSNTCTLIGWFWEKVN